MGRPRSIKPKPGQPIHLSFRVDGAIALRLDEEAERLSAERPGPKFTRTDVVRVALDEWLAARAKSSRKG